MKLRLLLVGFLLGFLSCREASATSYMWLSPAQVTERTDVWIHGRVLSVTGPTEKKVTGIGGGDYYENLALTLEIIASTDESVSGKVVVRPKSSHIRFIDAGQEVFVALKEDNGALVPYGGLGIYGWTPIDAASKTVKTQFGVIDTQVYWRFLEGIRHAASTGGDAPEEEITFWKSFLDSNDPARVRLGMSFLHSVLNPPLTGTELLESFFRLYENVADDPERSRFDIAALRDVLPTLSSSLKIYDGNEFKELLVDFIPYDASTLKLLDNDGEMELWLGLIQGITDSKLLAKIPEIYEQYVELDSASFKLLPTAPSAELDAWLWDIIQDPVAHKIDRSGDLTGVFHAMANRDMTDFLPYLRSVASGEVMPPVQDFGRDRPDIIRYSRDVLMPFELRTLDRRECLLEWVQRMKDGDRTVSGSLWREVTLDDTFLIPALSTLSSDQWLTEHHRPEHWPAAQIMEQIPDESFLPHLVRWAREPEPSYLLNAMVACGGRDEAIRVAEEYLSKSIQQTDFPAISRSLREITQLTLILGTMEDSHLAEHFIAYTERETLAPLEDAYMRNRRNSPIDTPLAAWRLRNAALLALTKLGHPEAVSRLKSIYELGDLRGKVTAAFALRSLGDGTGVELIDAYRNREDIPDSILQAVQHSSIWKTNLADSARLPIEYLESTRLDDLYFERCEKEFGRGDTEIIVAGHFTKRHRSDILNMLVSHVDDSGPETRADAVRMLQRLTKQDFGFDRYDLFIHQQPAIQKWKDYVASL